MTALEYKHMNEAPWQHALQSIFRRFPELTSMEQLALFAVPSGVPSVMAFDQHAVKVLQHTNRAGSGGFLEQRLEHSHGV